MSLKRPFANWRRGSVATVELPGFILALIVGIGISFFLEGVRFNLSTITFAVLGAILARLLASRNDHPLTELVDVPEVNTGLDPPKDLVSAASLRKLNLEIADLKWRSRWEQRVGRYLPPVTTAIAVLGVFVGLYQFQAQQRVQHDQDFRERQRDQATREAEQSARDLEQRIRIQNQIRIDLEELLQFPRDEKQTASGASFRLLDLKTILESQTNDGRLVKEVFRDYEPNATKNLVRTIKYDCDFSRNKRDLDFAIAVFEQWSEYGPYLKGDLDSLEKLLHMHIKAIRRLRADNPGYFESMENKPDGYYVAPRFDRQAGEERRYQHFLAITTGFTKHLELLNGISSEEGKKLKELALRKFQSALCNQEVSTDILKTYFPDEPCENTGG
jgi:hypothetical protein